MMLDHLGFPDAASLVMDATEETLQAGIYTPDLGGKASTERVTKAISDKINKLT